jgi:hypothetical protein
MKTKNLVLLFALGLLATSQVNADDQRPIVFNIPVDDTRTIFVEIEKWSLVDQHVGVGNIRGKITIVYPSSMKFVQMNRSVDGYNLTFKEGNVQFMFIQNITSTGPGLPPKGLWDIAAIGLVRILPDDSPELLPKPTAK